MKRYYISKLVGTGASRLDPLRPKSDDLAPVGRSEAIIPSGAVAGDWCLVVLDVADHTALLADTDLRDFPDLSLDAQLNTLPTQTRNRILTALTNAGMDTSTIRATDAFRVLVRLAGRHFDAAFDENKFDPV